MDAEMAADYAETLPEEARLVLLEGDLERWCRTDFQIDEDRFPFVSVNKVVKFLAASNLAEYQQGRMGNRYDCLIFKLNERGQALKQLLLNQGRGK